MVTFGRPDVLALMLERQHLSAASAGQEAVAVVDDLVGLHATVPQSPYLQLWARMASFQEQDLDTLLEAGRAARIGCMRRTLFIESAELIPVVFAATRPLTVRDRPRFLVASGLTPRSYERWAARVEATLAGRAMNARQLRDALATGEPLAPVLILMCDEGRLLRWKGPRGWASGPPTYRLLQEALPTVQLDAWDEVAAVRELIARYIHGYGPVREDDIGWWTGLDRTTVRATVESLPHLVHAHVDGLPGEFLVHEASLSDRPQSARSPEGALSLLPALDPYLQSYRDRERSVEPRHAPWVVDRGGNVTSVILVGGRAAGIWGLVTKPEPDLRLFFFEPPDASTRRRVDALAADIGRFLIGAPVRVREVEHMLPLTTRRLGGFLSPLTYLP